VLVQRFRMNPDAGLGDFVGSIYATVERPAG
jgi:hypothetical protein